MLKLFRQALFIIIITVTIAELSLRVFDPIGVLSLHASRETLWSSAIPHETRGYIYANGAYSSRDWSMRMIADGERFVAGNGSGRRVAFVGDSLTFGFGVDDTETFASLFSEASDCEIINAGHSGYNASQVLATVEDIDADMYIYLHYANDADVANRIPESRQFSHMLALEAYAFYFGIERQYQAPETDTGAYWQAMADFAGRDDVIIFTFAGLPLSDDLVAAYPDVIPIAVYEHPISAVDPHPDDEGHRDIYEHMQTHLVNQVCF